MPSVSRFTSWAVELGLFLLTFPALATAAPPEPGFWLMGLQPDGKDGQVRGLNQDGSMAAGTNTLLASGPGFTWTREGGRFDFGSLPGMPTGTPAMGLSDNGVVVGASSFGNAAHAYRWPGSGPLEDLGALPGTIGNTATGVSGDGNVVAGYGSDSIQFSGEAFRWTPDKGMQGLGWLRPLSIRSQANGVSRDGTTIVGYNTDFNLTDEAFIWTEATGMKALPNLPNAQLSASAHGVNADGSVVVGESYASDGSIRFVRWSNGEVKDLSMGLPPSISRGLAVSDDGSVIGGTYSTGVKNTAFVWTETTGSINLADYLQLNGITVPSDYKLEYVYTISGDGLTFGGSARNLLTNQTEGWVATVPAPGSMLVVVASCVLASRRRRG